MLTQDLYLTKILKKYILKKNTMYTFNACATHETFRLEGTVVSTVPYFNVQSTFAAEKKTTG